MKLIFLAGAKLELFEAARWYDGRRTGLGDHFLDEVELALNRLRAFPRSSPGTLSGYRRCLVRRFPYALIYRVTETAIVIVAVSHHKRRPGYWARRVAREDG